MKRKSAMELGLEILLLLAAGIAGYVGFMQIDIHDMVKSTAETQLRTDLGEPPITLQTDDLVVRINEEGLLNQWRAISLEEADQ